MEFDLEKYKSNPRTAYLAETFSRLEKEEEEIKTIVKDDQSMEALSKEELANIATQKAALIKQMEEVVKEEEVEEEFPNEIILEVRAGTGGE